MKRPFVLYKRGRVWYYRLAGERTYHSTGETARNRAEQKAAAKRLEKLPRGRVVSALTLREYSEPFYLADTDPRVLRRREEGHLVGAQHLRHSRRRIERYVWTDPLANKRLSEITRGDLLEFRRRLVVRLGDRRTTANKVMWSLKAILREAVYLQDLRADPTVGIGSLTEDRLAPGVLTEAELRMLFPAQGLGPWRDQREYTCFLLAATTGMRRGEIRGLHWRDLDLEAGVVQIRRAWKRFEHAEGVPKSGRPRVAPLPTVAIAAIEALRDVVIRHHPDDPVLCWDDGVRPGEGWWERRFARAMKAAGMDCQARRIRPHSLRHSLATILAAHEYDREKLRAALGWADDSIRQHYTHLGAEHLRGQADIVDAVLGKPPARN